MLRRRSFGGDDSFSRSREGTLSRVVDSCSLARALRVERLYEFSSPVDLRSSSLGIRFRRGTERTFDRTICLDRSAKGRGQFVRSSSPIQPGDPSSSFRNRVVRGSRLRVRKFGTSGRFEERIFVASYRRFLSRLQSPLFPFGILRRITNSKVPPNDPHPGRIGLLNHASAIMIRPEEMNRRSVRERREDRLGDRVDTKEDGRQKERRD